jgi:DNA-binding NarL/FixJ family response regulator
LLHALGELIPHDAACWGLVDQRTLWPITNSSTFPGRDHMPAVWNHEIAVPDPLKLADLARAPRPVGALCAATGGEPERAARYRAILAKLAISDELRAMLTAQGTAWGYLLLFRSSGQFTGGETALLAQATPVIGAALRDAVIGACVASDDEPPEPAVLVIDSADRCLSLTDQAREYIRLLPAGMASRLPEAINMVAAQARARAAGRTLHNARAVVPAQGGTWLTCQGATLDAGGTVAITLHPAQPTDIAPVLLRGYGLTDRECQIAAAVLRAQTTEAIASELFLSPWTVQDHLKAIFRKTGVRSRTELRLRLLPQPR